MRPAWRRDGLGREPASPHGPDRCGRGVDRRRVAGEARADRAGARAAGRGPARARSLRRRPLRALRRRRGAAPDRGRRPDRRLSLPAGLPGALARAARPAGGAPRRRLARRAAERRGGGDRRRAPGHALRARGLALARPWSHVCGACRSCLAWRSGSTRPPTPGRWRPRPAAGAARRGARRWCGDGVPRADARAARSVDRGGCGRVGDAARVHGASLVLSGPEPDHRGALDDHDRGRGGDEVRVADHRRPRDGPRAGDRGRARSGHVALLGGLERAAARRGRGHPRCARRARPRVRRRRPAAAAARVGSRRSIPPSAACSMPSSAATGRWRSWRARWTRPGPPRGRCRSWSCSGSCGAGSAGGTCGVRDRAIPASAAGRTAGRRWCRRTR